MKSTHPAIAASSLSAHPASIACFLPATSCVSWASLPDRVLARHLCKVRGLKRYFLQTAASPVTAASASHSATRFRLSSRPTSHLPRPLAPFLVTR
jgi:hypothetical protein